MKLNLKKAKYVVAVSGGVDSMVLLSLMNQTDSEIIAAHFNHGIRADSAEDEKLASDYCADNEILFVSEQGKLGPNTSEAEAREARYKFLQHVKDVNDFNYLATAHHQNDVIETAIINLIRGTSRKGLSSLKDTDEIKRPLLYYSKNEIVKYAEANKIPWREDPSNQDPKYLRNYVRNELIPSAKKIDPNFEASFLKHLNDAKNLNEELDSLMQDVKNQTGSGSKVDRSRFKELPNDIQKELVREYLGELDGVVNINKDHIEKLSLFISEGKNKKVYDLSKDWQVELSRDTAEFVHK